MKCELCNVDEPEPRQRLCLPCMEAVTRLWNIANNVAESHPRQNGKAPAAKGNRAAIAAVRPIADFL